MIIVQGKVEVKAAFPKNPQSFLRQKKPPRTLCSPSSQFFFQLWIFPGKAFSHILYRLYLHTIICQKPLRPPLAFLQNIAW